MKAIIDDAFAKAGRVLARNRPVLDRGAELLLQKETLNEHDLSEIARTIISAEAATKTAPSSKQPHLA